MLDDFLTRAVLAGLGTALAAAPLGCFLVWRRMAYFADATAHASLLGVAFAIAFTLPMFLGVMSMAMAMALFIALLAGRHYAVDTLLGVLSHTALAFGLLTISFLPEVRTDLMAYLFGDILAVGVADLVVIWGGAVAIVLLMAWRWQALLTATLDRDLAFASGLDPRREDLLLALTLAMVVAVALQVIGAILIAAMLIIPAAAARPLASTPESMVILAALFGMLATLAGVYASYLLDTPTGPTIIAAATFEFALANITALLLQRRG